MMLCLLSFLRCSRCSGVPVPADQVWWPKELEHLFLQRGVPRKEQWCSKNCRNTSGTPLEHLHIKLKIGFNRGWNTWNTRNTCLFIKPSVWHCCFYVWHKLQDRGLGETWVSPRWTRSPWRCFAPGLRPHPPSADGSPRVYARHKSSLPDARREKPVHMNESLIHVFSEVLRKSRNRLGPKPKTVSLASSTLLLMPGPGRSPVLPGLTIIFSRNPRPISNTKLTKY
jgi:hypothetical protein